MRDFVRNTTADVRSFGAIQSVAHESDKLNRTIERRYSVPDEYLGKDAEGPAGIARDDRAEISARRKSSEAKNDSEGKRSDRILQRMDIESALFPAFMAPPNDTREAHRASLNSLNVQVRRVPSTRLPCDIDIQRI